MKTYKLSIYFPDWISSATKQFKNKREAEKWTENCLAICGKDEKGRKYVHFELLRVD
jgi:hypothetical protein